MDNMKVQRRKDLAVELSAELEDANRRLSEIAVVIENESCAFYEEVFQENHEELEQETSLHNNNNERVAEINTEITAVINSWYEFLMNEDEAGNFFYPVSRYLRKRKLFNNIKLLKAELSNIMIMNRLIRERVAGLEKQLECKAVNLVRSAANYQEYERLLEKRKFLLAELKYLLPTIK